MRAMPLRRYADSCLDQKARLSRQTRREEGQEK